MEETIWEKALKMIESDPSLSTEEKAQLIADLSRDYAGRGDVLSTQLTGANERLMGALDMPQAQVAGPSSNPFAVAIAPNVLEYAAQGLRGYTAMKDREKALEGLEGLSEGRERGVGSIMSSALADRLREEERLRRFRT